MKLKNIIYIVLIVGYGIYYAGVSTGFIKKEFRYGRDVERTAFQTVVDVITPDSPKERAFKKFEKVGFLKEELQAREDDLIKYEKQIADMITNPPS